MSKQIKLNAYKDIQISLSILECRCLSFSLTDYAVKNKTPIEINNYEFSFTLNFNLNHISKQVRVNFFSKLFEKKEDKINLQLAELNATTLFSLANYDEIIVKNDNDESLIPAPLIELCNGITLSSARGMFSVKAEDTLYSNAVFSLVDIKKLLPNQPAIPFKH